MKNNKSKGKINKPPQLQNPTSVSKPFFAYLPQELVSEILYFLPVKSLTRFKCVCKSWLHLISNPKFIKTHLQKSNLFNNYAHQKLILSHSNGHDWSYVVKSLLLDINDKSYAVSLDYPTENPHCSVTLVGSCNGLVCLAINYVGVFLWNPCTGLSNKLPHSSRISDLPIFEDIKEFMLDGCSSYGFGYDPLNDDYKVVLIETVFCLEGYVDCKIKKEVRVYSMKFNSWKIIGDFPLSNDFDKRGEYVNGVIHWKVNLENVINSSVVMVSLDLGNETYGEIPQPYYDEAIFPYISLGVIKGCLSVFCHFDEPEEKTDIWVMEEYGVGDTWKKLYTIPDNIDLEIFYFSLLCISVTGEILFNSRRGLVIYNPNDGSLRNPEIGNLSGTLNELKAFTYVESLVSPQY